MNECMNEEHKGQCCCSCKYQSVAFCHPGNQNVGKGRVTTIMGYLCAAPDFSTPGGDKSAVFFEGKHGLCEMWSSSVIGLITYRGEGIGHYDSLDGSYLSEVES